MTWFKSEILFHSTAAAYCTRDPANPTDVIMTVSIRSYMLDTTARYLQALKYSAWQSNLAAAPEEQQVFVEKDASPVTGSCGKQITTSEETLNFTFNLWTTEKDRCGVHVVMIFKLTLSKHVHAIYRDFFQL